MKRILFCIFLSASVIFGYSQTVSSSRYVLPAFAEKYYNPVFGKNVFVFEPAMDAGEIQTLLDTVFVWQSGRGSEFTSNRFAFLFKPGTYNLDVKVGYYMQILGLGASPEDVIIKGAVRSNTRGSSVLTNFWRGVENLTIVPTADSTVVWGVSQASPMRRVHIKGNLQLFDKGYASGGFLADSKIDGIVTSGPQQQWLSRNTSWKEWQGGNWNMMFIGVPESPSGTWPEKPYTVIDKTPLIREKPFLSFDTKGFNVKIPVLKDNSSGPGWTDNYSDEKVTGISSFYIVNPVTDNTESINTALQKGKNLLFTPGVYKLNGAIKVTRKGTIVMGIGMPSLVPLNGNAVIDIADVDGVTLSGILVDAGSINSGSLINIGETGSVKRHINDPTFLYDVFVRVGGPAQGAATASVVINSSDVYVDHIWLWRADHGNGVGWEKNRAANGLIVNGNNVTVYGLFNEHYQEYQTLWNGNNGRVYFYQSEMPYDPPAAEAWKHDGIYGYASYKVADNVTSHEAWGIGIYNVFYDAPVIVDNAMETPTAIEKDIHNKIIFWLNGNKDSFVKSIINGKGGRIDINNRKAVMD